MLVVETPLSVNMLSPQQIGAIKKLFGMGNLDPLRHSTQKKMKAGWLASGSPVYLVLSSRQLGKTWDGLCDALETCIKEPGSRVLFYAPTKDKLRDIVNDTIVPISLFAPKGLIKRHKSSDRWTIGKSELRLCVLERAHVDKNRGLNCKGLMVIEEGCFVSSEDWDYAWGSVIRAQRLRWKPRVKINTTPSTDEMHSIHINLLPMLEAKGATARYTIYDNPFLSEADIAEIRSDVTEEVWAREFMAEITRSLTSTVMPEFNMADCVRKLTPPAYAHWILSLDQGGLLDPTAKILCYWDYVNKKFCVYKENVQPINTSVPDIIAAARAVESYKTGGGMLKLGDAAGQVHVEYVNNGYPFLQPDKPAGSFEANIQAVRVCMKNKNFWIDEGCEETIRQLMVGRYNKQRTDFLRDSKGHLDCIAALCYGYRYKNESNPFPLHTYGHVSTNHMANAPHKQNGMASALNSILSRYE